MPEGFATIDDLKVAITASTEGLEAGLGSARHLIERFSADGNSSLAKFDTGLAKAGQTVAKVGGQIGVAMEAAELAWQKLQQLVDGAEKYAKMAGLEKEFGQLKEAVGGLAPSLNSGLTAPLEVLAQRVAAFTGITGDAVTVTRTFGATAEISGYEVGRFESATGSATAAARDFRADLGLPAPDGWLATVVEQINKARSFLETFVADAKKSNGALDGEMADLANIFAGLRQSLEDVRDSKPLTLVEQLFGRASESEIIKALDDIIVRVNALKEERKSRPVADAEDFDKELEAIEKQAEALDQKYRLVGLSVGEAAKLVAEEKALEALGFEREELSARELAKLDEKLAKLAEAAELNRQANAEAAVTKAVEGLETEIAQLELRRSTIGKTADEVARLTAEFKIEQAAKAQNIALTDEQTEAYRRNAAEIGRLTLAIRAQEAVLATSKSIDAISDQVTALERQIAMSGQSAGAIAAAAAEERVWNEAKRAGIALTNAQIDRLQDETIALAEATDRKAALDKARSFDRDIGAAEREADTMRRRIEVMFMEAGAAAELSMQTKLLDAARRNNVDLSDEQRARINEIARAYGEATREVKQLEIGLSLVRDSGRLAANTLTQAFDQWMRGTEVKGRELVANLLREFAKLTLMQTVLNPAQNWFTQMLGGAFGGGGATSGTIPSSGGWSTSWQAMASGGTMTPGRPTLVGERGPELVMPLAASRVVPNHALSGMGGGTSMALNVTIDARGATRDTLPELERQVSDLQRNLPRLITETVRETRDRGMI